eukprot:gnl/Chilomastix_cuspidata/6569.p1 GENE.gnl/Chilomastix_cuspidata/6569~~gnl/Chilomastix_cuspidata/6569.p1  ORF type:complete len:417 (-),score=55.32 gnl/Chilomastix_cuspidata/6569:31-1281(-)
MAEDYIVDRVVDRRLARGASSLKPKYEYLTRWFGFGPTGDTWEPRQSFGDETLILKLARRTKNNPLIFHGEIVSCMEPAKKPCFFCGSTEFDKLVACSGWCGRSVCRKCLRCDKLPRPPWVCPDCRQGRGLCAFCGGFGFLWHKSRRIATLDNPNAVSESRGLFENNDFVHVCSTVGCTTMFHIPCARAARSLELVVHTEKEYGPTFRLVCGAHIAGCAPLPQRKLTCAQLWTSKEVAVSLAGKPQDKFVQVTATPLVLPRVPASSSTRKVRRKVVKVKQRRLTRARAMCRRSIPLVPKARPPEKELTIDDFDFGGAEVPRTTAQKRLPPKSIPPPAAVSTPVPVPAPVPAPTSAIASAPASTPLAPTPAPMNKIVSSPVSRPAPPEGPEMPQTQKPESVPVVVQKIEHSSSLFDF